MTTSDWIGAVGVAITLSAYFCSTFRWLSPQGKIFFMLNTIGAALTCLGSYLIAYWPFFVLEGTWAIVSLIGWIRAKER
ncbi:MAG TPA: hypothetical protein VHK91_09805 [Flavisolibacter sp.]|jgi:hypothetical protein|nr:hypothetical protein [Flavisolibacter sp.]